MKKSYIKIILFELFIFTVLLLNSFESSILRNYKMPIFIILLIFIFKIILGFEKDKNRYVKDIILSIFIDSIIYFIFYYLLGIIIGFAKNNEYFSVIGLFRFIIPCILTIITKEYLRYGIITKSKDSKLLLIITTILFMFFDISEVISVTNFKDSYSILKFLALTILPSITTNIYITYLSYKAGYKPAITYLLIMELSSYLLLIVPNPNIYLKSIIMFLLPAIFMIRLINFYNKEKVIRNVDRNYNKKSYIGLIFPLVITIILVYFISGYFKYYAIAVASSSMSPTFNRGSVVVVDTKYENIKKGDVIAFKTNDIVVIHRVINIKEYDDNNYYYTKGDANNNEDNYQIKKEDIVGVVKYKIPYIGYPTVWLSEL